MLPTWDFIEFEELFVGEGYASFGLQVDDGSAALHDVGGPAANFDTGDVAKEIEGSVASNVHL